MGVVLINSAFKLFSRFAIGTIMCLIVFFSFNFAITAGFSDVVGYKIYYYNQEIGKEEQVCYHDAENNPPADCVCANYDPERLNPLADRKLSDDRQNISLVLAQIFSFVMITGILCGTVWEMGNKDISAVKHGRKKENILRGLYVGLIAIIPSVAVYVLLVLSHMNVLNPNFLDTYRLLNSHFHYFLTLIYSGAENAAELTVKSVILCGALHLYLPVLSFISYVFGYKDINLVEKITYKKKAGK